MTSSVEPLEGTRKGDRVRWRPLSKNGWFLGVVAATGARGVSVVWDSDPDNPRVYPPDLWKSALLGGRAAYVQEEDFL